MSEMKIGFVGVGKMGQPMARRLIAAGYEVFAYDTDPVAVKAVVDDGAKAMPGPKAVADAADIVFASLPSPAVLEVVALGDGGIADGEKVRIFIDISTTGPRTAERVAQGLAKRNIVAVDRRSAAGLSACARASWR